jgi:hypothetical protein
MEQSKSSAPGTPHFLQILVAAPADAYKIKLLGCSQINLFD